MTTTTTKATPAPFATAEEAAPLIFGAVATAALLAAAGGPKFTVDLDGIEAKVPPVWQGRLAALRSIIAAGKAPTDAELLAKFRAGGELSAAREAIRDGAPLAGSAAGLVAALRKLPDHARPVGSVRIKVRHNGRVHSGAAEGRNKPRPVVVGEVVLTPGTELELTVAPAEHHRWCANKSVDVATVDG